MFLLVTSYKYVYPQKYSYKMVQRCIMLSTIYNREEYEVNKLYETFQTHISCVCPLVLNLTLFRRTTITREFYISHRNKCITLLYQLVCP